ncbi:LPXTG cell wall anchor domain-containing protein [Georgenia sp. 10Sc9-8]|uniref:LPXTG cell wall anchor domain-containing protein n=1 Tax=Georgenia halotolerans TaxID=3028317 RepID=A0ABT5TZ68_9MICO|nr:LPXTG cell wall anchor domain-containing protein [Georgenia halotolerans]
MYGTETAGTTSVAGSTLAATGLSVGAWALTAIGVIFVAVALLALVRRHSPDRP